MTGGKGGALNRAVRFIYAVEDGLLASVLGAMVILATAQIVLRNLFDASFIWGDPIVRVLVLWVGLLGAMAASRDGRHITVDVLSRVLKGRAKTAADVITNLFAAAVTGILAWQTGRFVAFDYEGGTIAIRQAPLVGDVPTWWLELIIPVAFAIMSLRFALVCGERVLAFVKGEPA
jgi:TRAP-type C4-dicarboxylate transport system permease small subunit